MTTSIQKSSDISQDLQRGHKSFLELYKIAMKSILYISMTWFDLCSRSAFLQRSRLRPYVNTPTPPPPFFTQQVVCTSPGGSSVHARTGAVAPFSVRFEGGDCASHTQTRAAILKVTPHSGSDRAAVRNHDWRWRILSSWRDMPDSGMGKRSRVWLNSLVNYFEPFPSTFCVCPHSGKLGGWFCANLRL